MVFPALMALVQLPFSSKVEIQISLLPILARRSETKYNVRPSAERDGCDSHSFVFTFLPKFFGEVHTSPAFMLSYRSQLPIPSLPEHEVNISLRPSAEMVQVPSFNG